MVSYVQRKEQECNNIWQDYVHVKVAPAPLVISDDIH